MGAVTFFNAGHHRRWHAQSWADVFRPRHADSGRCHHHQRGTALGRGGPAQFHAAVHVELLLPAGSKHQRADADGLAYRRHRGGDRPCRSPDPSARAARAVAGHRGDLSQAHQHDRHVQRSGGLAWLPRHPQPAAIARDARTIFSRITSPRSIRRRRIISRTTIITAYTNAAVAATSSESKS